MVNQTKAKKVGIIGLGLIGGSLAIALKINGYYVLGITKESETLELALKQRAINEGYTEFNSDKINEVDLIFLCTPLTNIPEYIELISKTVKNEVILTDVGSTKFEICNLAKEILPKNITFIGGHPMAGTEKAGFLSAQISLFKNCAWLLTPTDDTEKSKKALETLQKIIIQIGARPITTKAKIHDQAVALVSHLPLLASIVLCQLVKDTTDNELKELASLIASSGFRDTTRIGGGNPEMNSDLLISNISQLLLLLPKYNKKLEVLITLAKEEPKKLYENLHEVSIWRSKLYNSEGKNNLCYCLADVILPSKRLIK